jgi:hypothetical protein
MFLDIPDEVLLPAVGSPVVRGSDGGQTEPHASIVPGDIAMPVALTNFAAAADNVSVSCGTVTDSQISPLLMYGWNYVYVGAVLVRVYHLYMGERLLSSRICENGTHAVA